jgi:hypothetical protein
VFDLGAAVLDDLDPGRQGLAGGLVVVEAELGPDAVDIPPAQGFVEDGRKVFALAEDVDEIALFRDFAQTAVDLFPEDLLAFGVDRDDPVAGLLKIAGHLVALFLRFRRTADDGDGSGLLQDLPDLFRAGADRCFGGL